MYYGFDIGGTKIALGVFDKDLRLQWETRVPQKLSPEKQAELDRQIKEYLEGK